jgi:ribonucleotide monophosphatase NagD (HAD superfamily)
VLTPRPYLLVSPSAKEEFPFSTRADEYEYDYDSVILGLHEESLSYSDLNRAFRILKSEPVTFPGPTAAHRPSQKKKAPALIAPHAALFHQAPDGELPAGLSLGIGPFVRALELASGVQAELVGKPTRKFFELAINRLRENHPEFGKESVSEVVLDTRNVAVVGDDVINDLGEGASQLGLKRILGTLSKPEPSSHSQARSLTLQSGQVNTERE